MGKPGHLAMIDVPLCAWRYNIALHTQRETSPRCMSCFFALGPVSLVLLPCLSPPPPSAPAERHGGVYSLGDGSGDAERVGRLALLDGGDRVVQLADRLERVELAHDRTSGDALDGREHDGGATRGNLGWEVVSVCGWLVCVGE